MKMDTVVYGMMRSGTTLTCDLLTVPGKSLIFNEPMLMEDWPSARIEETNAIAKAFGLAVEDRPPTKEAFGTLAAYFDSALGPELAKLDNWGVKEVHFHYWRELLDRYQPDKLVLCVRDIRDIVLSALDLVHGSLLAFPGGKRMRDEAWLVARLRHDVREIMELRSRPHFLVRYEDLTRQTELQSQLAAFIGLDALGTGTISRDPITGTSRRRELEKHGRAISARSVGRHETEGDSPALALANYIWRIMPEYSEAFGYPVPRKRPDGKMDESGISWPEVQNWRWSGPRAFDPAFARRRARIVAARIIEEGTGVLDVGCTVPALKFLLPPECTYLGVDEVARPPMIAAAKWQEGALPEAPAVDLITVLGSLEFIADVPRFLKALKAHNKLVLLTYHAIDDTQGLDRALYGWQSHLSRGDLMQILTEAGFEVQSRWAFDDYQSLFRLKP